MPFPDRTQAQDEAPPTLWRAGLIGMSDDARIEQRCRFEGILVQEIGADQPALVLRESHMGRKGFFHLISARLEYLEQIAMAPLEVLEHLGQLVGSGFGIEGEHSGDDVVRACLVGSIEVAWFGRRLERAHYDSCRIRAHIQTLSVQKCGWRQNALDLSCVQIQPESGAPSAKCRG